MASEENPTGQTEESTAPKPMLQAAYEKIKDHERCDFLYFNGEVDRAFNMRLLLRISDIPEQNSHNGFRDTLLFFVKTNGGNPRAAFLAMRALQQLYKKIVFVIPDACKSAGTLMALGADELAFGLLGELGPLDVQVSKKDEFGEQISTMVISDALSEIHEQVKKRFRDLVMYLRFETGFSTSRAADWAHKIIASLYQPVFAQIDPTHLGENSRRFRIATEYGNRLVRKNVRQGSVQALAEAYPSHDFVIDAQEAEKLFHSVRPMTMEENTFWLWLQNLHKKQEKDDGFFILSDYIEKDGEEKS
jgi:hypothetical protein